MRRQPSPPKPAPGPASATPRRKNGAEKKSLAAERVSFAQRELERHQRLARQLAEQGQRLRRELEQVAQRQLEVTQALADTRTQLAQALRQAERCHKRAVQAESQASALKTQVDQQQRETGLLRQQEQESQRRLHQLEVQRAAAAAQLAHAQQSLGGLPPAQLPEPASAPQLRERQRLLQDQLAQMGPVNELAVVQEQELGQRLKFLSEQKKDLERSLASLQETIRQLDETSKERFLHTLREANRNFGEVFRELFGGGEAYVALSDPENPLESGVDVKVRPPGKHTQSVLLLSGGEKALAAVALLLALFRIRPAPFCVLDEVDAPLDDLNVERLCHHLKAQAEQTQFLIITHNRRTMAHADVLYGVTMEEPGVSRVVSVRLEEP
ncbi:MAG: hypothetical protein RMI39_04935 [Thermoanaerobaculum sp.]|nr:hypothetical protein [Thermoanaerobaculum sp.]